ncbi:MAG: hypothetical protein ACREV6_10425 [Clostridium sp.]|uniref:hypothetical protein n=1 Tax=Clostridium sp. TaxID=1506 RepID=UPI003D6D3D4F
MVQVDLDLNLLVLFISHDDIVFWLEDRVVPKERANIDEILKAMGLIDYDFWQLCRKTRAM